MNYVIEKQNAIFSMSPKHEPTLHVQSGDTVVFETYDCFEDQIQNEQQDFGELDWNHINPATGPVYVEGAEPGDHLIVRIQNMELDSRGVMTTGPNLGVLGDELTQNVIRMIPIRDNKVVFSDDIELPLSPMIGVIGTAPKEGEIACGTPGDHGGNMDCKRITVGAYVVFPVNVPGALFSLGDLHASMGDGEVAVCGVEVSGKVTVQLHVVKGKSWPAPMIFDDSRIITIAAQEDLDSASVKAVKNMVRFLESECGMDKAEAVFLLSAGSDLRVCQIVDPMITARVELPRWVAEKKGFDFKSVLAD
ncbi:acetamidase/formamidase family protein [Alicyclobacillus ferrooxydans]|uniref:Acetamidase n=1 Tax=Alicyclobacillus ferrooxydans TaxID=471514 RepID=A0A0P9EV91_9BACL|nr:acetamidase/formamidase family protein [Alicyclobacillus ferrooxydans]KPV42906.1 acetamidase [Alicyclobacillus ferrooxydans]